MAVIITDRDIPKDCGHCWNHFDCQFYDGYEVLHRPPYKHKDCPLKSTEDMIAEIDTLKRTLREERFNKTTIDVCIERVQDIVHKYCDKTDDGTRPYYANDWL